MDTQVPHLGIHPIPGDMTPSIYSNRYHINSRFNLSDAITDDLSTHQDFTPNDAIMSRLVNITPTLTQRGKTKNTKNWRNPTATNHCDVSYTFVGPLTSIMAGSGTLRPRPSIQFNPGKLTCHPDYSKLYTSSEGKGRGPKACGKRWQATATYNPIYTHQWSTPSYPKLSSQSPSSQTRKRKTQQRLQCL